VLVRCGGYRRVRDAHLIAHRVIAILLVTPLASVAVNQLIASVIGEVGHVGVSATPLGHAQGGCDRLVGMSAHYPPAASVI